MPTDETQGFTANQVLLAFLLGMMLGVFLMSYFQPSSILTLPLLRRLSDFLRFTMRFT